MAIKAGMQVKDGVSVAVMVNFKPGMRLKKRIKWALSKIQKLF